MPVDTPQRRADTQSIELVAGQRLVVEHRPHGDVIQIVAGDGRMAMSIRVTPTGAVLELDGVDLKLQTKGDLSIEAERLALHGRSSVAVTTDGELALRSSGDLTSEARIQNVTATLGNVNVCANDDVKLVGERIRMNC